MANSTLLTSTQTYITLSLIPCELNNCLSRLVVVCQRVQERIFQLVQPLKVEKVLVIECFQERFHLRLFKPWIM